MKASGELGLHTAPLFRGLQRDQASQIRCKLSNSLNDIRPLTLREVGLNSKAPDTINLDEFSDMETAVKYSPLAYFKEALDLLKEQQKGHVNSKQINLAIKKMMLGFLIGDNFLRPHAI